MGRFDWCKRKITIYALIAECPAAVVKIVPLNDYFFRHGTD